MARWEKAKKYYPDYRGSPIPSDNALALAGAIPGHPKYLCPREIVQESEEGPQRNRLMRRTPKGRPAAGGR